MALRAIARGVSGQTGPAFTALGASGPIGVSEARCITSFLERMRQTTLGWLPNAKNDEQGPKRDATKESGDGEKEKKVVSTMHPTGKTELDQFTKGQIAKGRMLYAKSLHRKIGNRGVKIHRPDPREAASKTATKAVFSGLILVPKDYVPSKERSTASKGADWLRLAGLSLSDLGGGGSMDKVEEEAWNLYVAMNKARAEGDINQINLLCADPVARMLIHEIKERRKAKIKKVHLEIAPMGAPDRHVEIMWGGKGDVPDQEDVPPSQRVKAIQLVVRASSYQSLRVRGWGHVEGMAAEKEMVEEHFIMEKLTNLPSYMYRGWRVVARYMKVPQSTGAVSTGRTGDVAIPE